MKSSTILGRVSVGECVLLKILYRESTLRGYAAEQKKLGWAFTARAWTSEGRFHVSREGS